MSDVEHTVFSALQLPRGHKPLRWIISMVAVVAVSAGIMAVSPRSAGASSLTNDRTKAATLLSQINRINGQVELLSQKYDKAQINLRRLNDEIANTKAVVASIESNVAKGNSQLRTDVIFAYVTNGPNQGNNPLFSKNASKAGATTVYTQLAEGNISATVASLKNYRIQLTQERGLLNAQDANARAVTRDAAKSYHTSRILQSSLNQALGQVKGQIAVFVNQAEAAAAAQSVSTLRNAQPNSNFPAPPPDSRADIAIRAALTFIGTPYVWGGASKYGVDCSGLIMLSYDAAGIYLPHYSGGQYSDTVRVPLTDIQPGDLLFYGYNGDQHVAMYVGHDQMIEAEQTGTRVHIVPLRLGYGFAGLGRPRA